MSKKRSTTDSPKGYRITCVISKIEQFDLDETQEFHQQVVLVATDTIESINVSHCTINANNEIALNGADNIVIIPNHDKSIWVNDVGGTGGIKITL